jgi:hypothetical protein
MGENLSELQKEKEDIEILLSTLEEAYSDASITKEHYDEVKGKNQKKLEDINKKIIGLEEPSKQPKEPEKPASKTKEKKKPGRPKKEKTSSSPESPAVPATPPATPPPSTAPVPATPEPPPQPDYSGIPQPLTDVAGDEETPDTKPDKAPGGARTSKPGTVQYTAEEIKEMLGKVLNEIKPQGIEVIPRVDKLEVQIEKIIAYIDAMKDERSGGKENMQRLNEEMGELRSSISMLDRKVSESEINVSEINETIGDLRPGRFIKALEQEDESIKMHDARLDKLDDLNSVVIKKLGQIEDVLKKLGSLEKIVNFSKEAAKRLLEIENREKRINRIADKIDSIFMELNKRLDEFALYKAKQDTLDELSQEMMKSVDALNTKMEKYAEKTELDLFKETVQTEISSIRTGAGTSPEVQKMESQKTEIESLVAMLDEQFKAGALPEKEYQKTKQINLNRIADIDKKIAAIQSGAPVQAAPEESPEEWAEKAKSVPGQEKEETKPAESGALPKGDVSKGEGEAKTGTQPQGKEDAETEKSKEMHAELEESHKKGLISKESLEKTKGLIGGAKGLFRNKPKGGNDEKE